MKDYGLVSIITPSYNSSKYIAETIESVLNQTYTNWEMIITDDCSTDNTCEIVEIYIKNDSRIKLLHLNENSGAGIARNNSIKVAKGKYIAFLDSDDLWLPYKLERQLDFMNKKDIGVSYTSSLTCRENGEIFAFNPAYKSVTYKQICNCDKAGTTELIYDVSKYGKIFMPSIKRRQDWAFKILLLKKSQVAYGMFETLSIYRIRTDSLSRKKIKLIRYNILVYRLILNMSLWSAWLKFLFMFVPAMLRKRFRQKVANSNI